MVLVVGRLTADGRPLTAANRQAHADCGLWAAVGGRPSAVVHCATPMRLSSPRMSDWVGPSTTAFSPMTE